MGITGLLPFLKKASREVNVRNFSGATVAVDAYCWLHKGAFSCAEKLGKGEKADGHVVFCVKMVNSLLAAGVIPILVFDGRNLPSKSVTTIRRREMKSKNKQLAKTHLLQGNLREAREYFQRCVEITSQMALQAIQACRKLGVDCIVAPYEADAQLAYLNKIGIAQIIITEDSDLVLFGCDRILYKLDMNGNGVLLESSKINLCLGGQAENFTFAKFRHMCILSGCDYLPSLPGIGLGKSCKFFSKITNPDLNAILPKIPYYLKMPSLVVSAEYKMGFIQADNTFLYQLVFDPLQRSLVPLNPYPPDLNPETMAYAGKRLDDEVAYQIALGNIDVDTMEVVDNFDPELGSFTPRSNSWTSKISTTNKVTKSIWSKNSSQSASDENEERITLKPKPSAPSLIDPLKILRNVAQKRTLSEPNLQTAELSDNDLVSLYGDATKSPMEIKRDGADDDDDAVVRPSPIKRCKYFECPAEILPEEAMILSTSHQTLEMSNSNTDKHLNLETSTGSQKSPPPSSDSMDVTCKDISLTPEDFRETVAREDITEPQFQKNDSEKELISATTPTPRGRLLFDRAMTSRTPLSSAAQKTPNAPAVVPKTPSASAGKTFSGKWKSLRSLFEFKPSTSSACSGGESDHDRNVQVTKSPFNHTDYKSVVTQSTKMSTSCSFNSFSEDLSPVCSQNSAASSFSSSASSTSPPVQGDFDVQVISAPMYASEVMRPAVTNDKTSSVHSKCRVSGLSRKKYKTKRSTSSQSASTTPNSKQLSLKETLARFSYQKNQQFI